jgi:hypothetical protein
MSRCPKCEIRGSGYVKPDKKDPALDSDLQKMIALREQQDTKYFPNYSSAKDASLSTAVDTTAATDAFQVLKRTVRK